MSTGREHPLDVIVVGGGVMGLWTALRAAERGAAVTVVDPAPAVARVGRPPGC